MRKDALVKEIEGDKAPQSFRAMRGVGKHLWADEPGDVFIDRLRSEDLPALPEVSGTAAQDLAALIWQRIETHQGEQFSTVTGLAFQYEVEGAGLWFFRDGRRINRKLPKRQVETAISRCPLRSTTEINDLMDFAYLFALLRDSRIRGDAW